MNDEIKQPGPLKFISDFLAPINTIIFLGMSIVDIFTPKLGRENSIILIGIMLISALSFFISYIKYSKNKHNKITIFFTQKKFILSFFIVILAGSMLMFKTVNAQPIALASTIAPNLVNAIQRDLGIIQEQNKTIITKVDLVDSKVVDVQKTVNEIKENNKNLVAEIISQLKPQFEKQLIAEIPNYNKLKSNQQDALILFSSKVGVNGIKKYKKLTKQINDYAINQNEKNENEIKSQLKYIVNINGKQVEDTRTRLVILSMFFDPETYAYIEGTGPIPKDTRLLTQFGIDVTKPLNEQLKDPLGDLIKELQAKGQSIQEQIVIPKEQTIQTKKKPEKFVLRGLIF